MNHVAITANRLRDGVPVWRAPDRSWADHFAGAATFPKADAVAALEEAKKDIARQVVVGVYSFEVSLADGHAVPESVRETIRAHGPSVRLDLGPQAEAA